MGSLGLSPYLIAPVIAWVLAQGIKYALNRQPKVKDQWRLLYQSGSMPSAHTATLVALTTVVGVKDGVNSGLFAVALLVSAIAAYDAVMVRRSGGEQGLALHKLLGLSPFSKDPLPYHALGHKPLEVAAGALLGLIVAFFITI